MTYVKKSHTRLYLAVILAAVLTVATFVAAYAVMSAPAPVEVGVNVGDTFTYKIKGTAEFATPDTENTPGFSVYNETDYYKIIITDVNDTQVSMDTTWRFINGTEINLKQTLDVGNGNKTDSTGYWALYPANLEPNSLLRPRGYDNTHVNKTETKFYTSGPRETNFWFINNEFYDTNDPTRSTLMYDYRNIYFDKETGMLVTYDEYMVYNNPQMQEVISWELIDTSVWQV
jgi:hypothetical protein